MPLLKIADMTPLLVNYPGTTSYSLSSMAMVHVNCPRPPATADPEEVLDLYMKSVIHSPGGLLLTPAQIWLEDLPHGHLQTLAKKWLLIELVKNCYKSVLGTGLINLSSIVSEKSGIENNS